MSDPSSNRDDRRVFRALPSAQLPPKGTSPSSMEFFPDPPPWRRFSSHMDAERGEGFVPPAHIDVLVNAALYLRRPILVEGDPGSGKTSLAYAVARELNLPGPFRWSITSRSTLRDGLYHYDAIGRLHAVNLSAQPGHSEVLTDVESYLRLGPLGMAFKVSQPKRPAVLLIDEIDKSDIDLPNDLLHVFEEGWFEIPELVRERRTEATVLPYRSRGTDEAAPVNIERGIVDCVEFPFVVLTSNSEREFPPAFLRRCLRVKMEIPRDRDRYLEILRNRFGTTGMDKQSDVGKLVDVFLKELQDPKKQYATDQLLNAAHLLLHAATEGDRAKVIKDFESGEPLRHIIFAPLNRS